MTRGMTRRRWEEEEEGGSWGRNERERGGLLNVRGICGLSTNISDIWS